MRTRKTTHLLAISTLGLGLAMTLPLCPTALAAEPSAAQRLDNATIVTKIKAKLVADSATRGFNINVDAQNGVVTLRGTAPSEGAKAKAEEIARSIRGVTEIKNELLVGEASLNPQTTTARAAQAVKKGEQEAGEAWEATKDKTSQAVQAGKQEAGEAWEATKDKTSQAVQAGKQGTGDAWISAKVKSRLMANTETRGLGIHVTTEKGIVTLVGTVPSKAIRKQAIELAKGVQGVKKVHARELRVGPS